ncbi:DUF3300 domain-containing protein [Roseomonas sp. AR75]|uniref:DUF3300 domain-containing protein n=1 Tax=Roseomonas sp. AR75 TaxID=2562311 RepID=UPI001485BB7E|nr:DUF3300 domain-containing protein [Roseomonas sp. AR75]
MALLLAAGFGSAVCLHPSPRQAWAQAPASAPATPQSAAERLDQGQLEALLAPIALYPDSLLMQVLMASTYPLEVVQAKRWLGQGSNAQLKGEDLAKALEGQSWDPSVKSLVPFPDVLTMMNDQLDWTQQVGDALLGQQEDVLNAVQVLRGRAHAAGNLQSGPQQTVNVTTNVTVPPPAPGAPAPVVAPPQQVITIAPTQPETVYVPAYNPSVVYGSWPYPSYPPTYYPPPPSWGIGNALLTGMAFAGGVALVGSLWGWASPSWGRGNVDVNVNRYNNINVNRNQITSNQWRHDSSHRHGVAYRNDQVRNTYRPDAGAQRADARDQFRGRAEQIQRQGGLDRAPIGGDRPGAGDRPGLGDRPGAGDRPGLGERPGGGDRPGLGDRPGAGDRPSLGDRPGAGAAQRPADRPGSGAAQRPADRPSQRPAERPAQRPAVADRQPAVSQSGRPQVQRPAPQPANRGALQGASNPQFDRAAASRGQASRQAAQARPAPQRAAAPRAGGGAAARGGGRR